MVTPQCEAPVSSVVANGAGATPPPLEVHDLTVAYHRRPVLWDIDFSLPEGKLIGIVGPNGAGSPRSSRRRWAWCLWLRGGEDLRQAA